MNLAPERLVTASDLERLSWEGHRCELVGGELQEMSPVGGNQGAKTVRLIAQVVPFILEKQLGEPFTSETGFLLSRDPDTVLAPDFAFIRQGRLPGAVPESWVPVVPDLVLETRSAHDSEREIREKAELWLRYGVQVVWDLDPKRRRLTLYRQGEPPEVLGPADVLTEPGLLPGFSLNLNEVL